MDQSKLTSWNQRSTPRARAACLLTACEAQARKIRLIVPIYSWPTFSRANSVFDSGREQLPL
jgi:hypothetical protein